MSHRVVLQPVGAETIAQPGQPLADLLVAHGAEFPCGGRGRCRGCRVRVAEGALAETPADVVQLSAAERAQGWRLACQAQVDGDLTIELRQWSGLILADDTAFPFTPAEGLGLAADIGTTTMVAQLVDLATGRVLGTQTAMNPQARDGADVMSRMCAALAPGGGDRLRDAVRDQLARMAAALLAGAGESAALARATIVGNTAMHHLLLGLDVRSLAAAPYVPARMEGAELAGRELGWEDGAAGARVRVLANLGGFVGSDILAVILATRLHEAPEFSGAADLGTNGEIVAGGRDGLLVASTAAGPAFEGARISQGMRAAPGAIDRVTADGGRPSCHVIGGGAPRGLCGSGLVDAVKCGLDLGVIAPSGRMSEDPWTLRGPVSLRQRDVRELQLAKGAIAAGLALLLDRAGKSPAEVRRFFLAGAFGNALSVANARRIGLLPFAEEAIMPVGNAALLGAKMALFLPGDGRDLLPPVTHVALEQDPVFQDRFSDELGFPDIVGAAT